MKKLVLAVAALALSTVAVTAQTLTPMPAFHAGKFSGEMLGITRRLSG